MISDKNVKRFKGSFEVSLTFFSTAPIESTKPVLNN